MASNPEDDDEIARILQTEIDGHEEDRFESPQDTLRHFIICWQNEVNAPRLLVHK